MKKTISTLLSIFMSLALLATSCLGAGTTPTLTVNDATAEQGKAFSVNISASGNTGVCALSFRIKYDKNVFTCSNVKSDAFDSASLGSADALGSVVVADNSSNYSGNGVIATVEFTVKDTAALGDYQFALDNISAANESEQDVTFTAVLGKVTVVAAGDNKPADTPVDDFACETQNNQITITEFKGEGTVVSVAEEYEIGGVTYPVTSIGEEAFSYMEDIKEVYIPDTITEIGASAFSQCTSLEKLEINGNPEIGENATLGCTSLTNIIINGNPTIDSHALGYYKKSKTYYKVEGVQISGWRGDSNVISNAQQYAKDNEITFVPLEKFSFRGYQTTDLTANKFNIRFVSSIDGLNYLAVKYVVSESGTSKQWTSSGTKVYKALNGQTADGSVFEAVTASQFGDRYLYAFAIKNIPTNLALNFTVDVYVENVIGSWVKTGVATVSKDLGGNWSYNYEKISD